VEPVRQKISLRERSGRTLELRLAVRFPWIADVWSRLVARLPPSSRLRQALLLRAAQGGLEATNRGDLDVVVLGFHPDVEFHPPPHFGEHGALGFQPIYRGHEGYRKFHADWLSGWGDSRFEPQELIDLGDRVLVLLQTTARGEASGISLTQNMAVLTTFSSNGKIIREQRYWDHAEALEAVGLA
jgi:ketosteroid isomerase-like protein